MVLNGAPRLQKRPWRAISDISIRPFLATLSKTLARLPLDGELVASSRLYCIVYRYAIQSGYQHHDTEPPMNKSHLRYVARKHVNPEFCMQRD